MIRKSWTYGLVALAALGIATPSVAQSIQIGPDGIRLVEPGREGQRRDERGGPSREGPQRGGPSREIGERDAVRIARAEGVREVDTVSRNRSSYRVLGVDRRGDDIQVDVDRRTGEVLAVR
ncbi:PepSY domain-containing protein [Aureimonas populi]|uniref:PepSY domain-containing protein n=1 Tax=Aureimonas populi TaxID=1701758 RepID=A0ABW5CM18_9HYPH|nr:PepSY domain-containing protein [Aureimonas populi]